MIRQIAEIIQKGRTFLVTSHVRLDGDAVGSELALYEALKGLGDEERREGEGKERAAHRTAEDSRAKARGSRHRRCSVRIGRRAAVSERQRVAGETSVCASR